MGLGSPKEDWGGQNKLLGGSGRGLDCPSPRKNVLGSCAPFWSSLEPIKIIPPKLLPRVCSFLHVANSKNHFSVLRLLDFSDDLTGSITLCSVDLCPHSLLWAAFLLVATPVPHAPGSSPSPSLQCWRVPGVPGQVLPFPVCGSHPVSCS